MNPGLLTLSNRWSCGTWKRAVKMDENKAAGALAEVEIFTLEKSSNRWNKVLEVLEVFGNGDLLRMGGRRS